MTQDNKVFRVESQWKMVFRRLNKNRMAMVSFYIIIVIILACIVVPMISPYNYNFHDSTASQQPPSAKHLLGTTDHGLDVFTRLFYGGRISLVIALAVTFIEVLIGTILGCIAGYYGKWVDTLIMRLVEIFLSLPFMLIAITIVAVFGTPDAAQFPGLSRLVDSIGVDRWSVILLILVLGLLSWPSMARIVRGQVLTIREMEYMEACEALGIRDWHKIVRHILPNVMASVIVYATMGIASVIMTETAMSFLGLGVNPVTPTWGNMIQEARSFVNIQQRLWLWVPAGFMIFITVMCFNLLGDGLRDALDPKMKV